MKEAIAEAVNEMVWYHATHPAPVPDGKCALSDRTSYARRCLSVVVRGLRTVLIRANGRLSYVSARRLASCAVGGIIQSAGCEPSAASRACRQLRRTAYNG